VVRGLMSDEEWAFFAPFVIEAGPRRGRRPRDHRLVLDGVFWIARTGSPWRDLHDHFGKWDTVYGQFRRWTLGGVWDVLLAALNETGQGQDSVQMIDSTIIRAHQHAAGAKKKAGPQGEGLGRSRGGFSTKIHLRANGIGLPVAIVLTGGETSDVKGYVPLMAQPGPVPRVLMGDKGYDADAILAERCFSKLKHSRRLATRYDKTADSYIGFVLVASVRLWVKHLINRT